jgi:dihydroneopterin triphosphate diphosphatase
VQNETVLQPGALRFSMPQTFKIPQSVLVVIHTPALDVLLIRRADYPADEGEFWQSVTGSKDAPNEAFEQTAAREVLEETGIDCAPGSPLADALVDWQLENVYDIYPRWLARYAPGVRRNTEHLFGLQVPANTRVTLNSREHSACQWLPWREAAARCYSPSNSEAILMLPRFTAQSTPQITT